MKILKLTTIALALLAIQAKSQTPNFEWAIATSGTSNELVSSVATNNVGEVYIAGYFSGTVDFDPGPSVLNLTSNGFGDVFIKKVDNQGNLLWARSFGGAGFDGADEIVLDDSGNVYITGSFQQTVDFDPGLSSLLKTSNGHRDLYFSKFDSFGNLKWSLATGSSGHDGGTSIDIDSGGMIYLAGYFSATVDFDPGPGVFNLTSNGGGTDIFIQKMDGSGSLIWAKSMGSNNTASERPNKIVVDGTGHVYITGGFLGVADFDPGPGVFSLVSNGQADLFVLKLDASGNLVWVISIGNTFNEWPGEMVIDNLGNVYVNGSFGGTLDFDPGPGVFNLTTTGFAPFIFKLNANGSFGWAKALAGSGRSQSITSDISNNLYITGWFEATVDFDTGPGVFNLTSNGGLDVFIGKYDPTGNMVWAQSFGGPGLFDRGFSIALDGINNVYVGGIFSGSCDFNPGPGVTTINATGGDDGFLIKLSQCTLTPPVPDVANLPDLINECTVVAPMAPTASDTCGNTYTGTPDVTFPITTQGTTVVTWTYTGSGGASTQTQNIIINDTTAPVPNLASLPDLVGQGSVSSPSTPTATDNCSGFVFGTTSTTFPVTTVGTTVVTWVFDDGNGNITTQTQNVIITGGTSSGGDTVYYEWANTFGGSSSEYGKAITTDNDGNVYTAGIFYGITDLDPGPGVASFNAGLGSDMFIQKTDAHGNLIWVKVITGNNNCRVNDIDLDNAGNIYTTGVFRGTSDFDPDTAVYHLMSNFDDIFILKLDTNGGFVWAQSLGGSLDGGNGIATDHNGNVYVAGYCKDTIDFDAGPGVFIVTTGVSSFFLLKLDPNGGFQWVSTFSTGAGWAHDVAVDATGFPYITGSFTKNVNFHPSSGTPSLSSNGISDVFIAKFDTSGTQLWAKAFGGPHVDQGNSIAVDEFGDVYVAGTYRDTVDFDPDLGVDLRIAAGVQNSFVQKMDPSGNRVWTATMDGAGDLCQAITTDTSSNIYITGGFSATTDFDPGPGLYNLSNGPGPRDIYVSKLNRFGNFVWAQAVGGTDYDQGDAIAVTNRGEVYTTGYFNDTVDFDPGSGTDIFISNGDEDAFVLKLSQCKPTSPAPDVTNLPALTGECTVTAPTAPTASDSCGNVYTGTPDVTFPITTQGTTVVTWTYTGSTGISTQTQNVIVTDTTAPVADKANLPDLAGQCAVALPTAPTATDNCSATVTATTSTSFPITNQGTTVITWTYDDGNGNITSQTQNVIILDNTAPIADLANLPDLTGQCSVALPMAPTATDNCAGTITATTTTNFPITTQGTTVITWTYDDGNGNISSQTQNVIINDNTAPVPTLTNLPDVVGECQVDAPAPPTATDNCSGSITGISSATFPITTPGTTTITWTYDDGNGNISTQNQNIIVTDTTAPTPDVTALPGISGQCSVTTPTAPTATDNCGGIIIGTPDVSFPITSTTVVNWTYDDGYGNISSQTQLVTVIDSVAPEPDLVYLPGLHGQCSVTPTAPTASDHCVGTVVGVPNVIFPITSTTLVIWTYDDGNGNISTQTQKVFVFDNTPPVPDSANLPDLTDECFIDTAFAPTATDNCKGTITATTTTTFPITTSTTITWVFNDGNGNISTQTQNVIITPIDSTTFLNGTEITATASGYTYQWLDCNNGNAAIAGAANASFTPTVTGSYAVQISNGTCSVTSACVDVIISGLDDIMNTMGIRVYPNPTTGLLYINRDNNSEMQIELLDNMGRLLFAQKTNQQQTSIDMSNYAIGIYFVKLTTQEKSITQKVVKN